MMLDAIEAAVRRLTVLGKERGHVTGDEFFAALDPEQVSSEKIKDTPVALGYVGIHVVLDDGPGDGDEPAAGPRRPSSPGRGPGGRPARIPPVPATRGTT